MGNNLSKEEEGILGFRPEQQLLPGGAEVDQVVEVAV